MRTLSLLLALSMLAGGCADIASLTSRQTTFAVPGKCGDLARQRLADAQLMGLAEGYEKAIFDRNYQDCLKMEAASRLPQL